MGEQQNEKTPAGRYLKTRMEQVGYRRKVDLADAAGVSPSTITRLFSVPTYRPDVENVRKLAAALQVGPDQLMAGMAGEATTPAEAPQLHPLAAELGRMLAADSPLPVSTRLVQEVLVDRALEPARREMRTAGDLVLPEDPHMKALIEAWREKGELVSPAHVERRRAVADALRNMPQPQGLMTSGSYARHTHITKDDDGDIVADLDASKELDAKLILVRTRAAVMPTADRARLLAQLDVLLEWEQSRIDAAMSVEERAERDRVLGEMPFKRPVKADVRERHDAGR